MNPHDGNSLDRPEDDPREAELGRLFTQRRRRDEAGAPSYERPLHPPARARSERWHFSPARWAAAGAFLLALAVLAVLWRNQPGSAPPPALSPAAATFATWKAPTDFLLAVPGGELLDSTPAFPDPNLPTPPNGG
jgi:hypothetical protein